MSRRKRGASRPSGFLVVDKPPGLSSFEVVRRVRNAMRVRKVGHGGTLDPFATGVLPLCVNDATKVAGLLLEADKVYRATAELGVRTNTFDLTGEVLGRCPAPTDRGRLEQVLGSFRGEIEQVPPAFSALKVGGERAYERARRGEEVQLQARQVRIDELEVEAFDPPRVVLRVSCGKGTYIRALVAAVGDALGCGATVVALRRLRSGWFGEGRAVSLSAVEALGPKQSLISIDEALGHLEAVDVAIADAQLLLQGRAIPVTLQAGDRVRARCGGQVVAVGRVEAGCLHPERVLAAVIEEIVQRFQVVEEADQTVAR